MSYTQSNIIRICLLKENNVVDPEKMRIMLELFPKHHSLTLISTQICKS